MGSRKQSTFNKKKSAELIFRDPKIRRKLSEPEPIVDFPHAKSQVMLGIVVTDDFRFGEHISKLLTTSAQSLYAMRVLRTHGMPEASLHKVFQATCLSKITYAASSWWGFYALRRARAPRV